MYDVTLYQVKSPAESKAAWDYYKKIAGVPVQEALPPLDSALLPVCGVAIANCSRPA